MTGSKYPSEWLSRVPAVVFASLSPGTLRVLLHPGSGLAQGGAPRDIDIELVPRDLRVPNTRLWAKLDEKMNILEVWRREE
jgi:hypothetical protein